MVSLGNNILKFVECGDQLVLRTVVDARDQLFHFEKLLMSHIRSRCALDKKVEKKAKKPSLAVTSQIAQLALCRQVWIRIPC